MKHKKLLITFIIIFVILSAIASGIFYLFCINDPFIKFVPDNAKVYSLINLKQENVGNTDETVNKKNEIIKNIISNQEFQKIKNEYKSKIGFYFDNENYYIILKKKRNAKSINISDIQNKINKKTKNEIKINKFENKKYVIFSNSENIFAPKININFLKDTYISLIKNNDIDFIFNKDLVKIYGDSEYLNNKFFGNRDSVFIKKYVLAYLKYENNRISFIIDDIKSDEIEFKNKYTTDFSNNFLAINNISLSKLFFGFLEKYENEELKVNENLNYFLKNIKEDGFEINSIKNILSNDSNVFIKFKDSNINLKNIESFLIIINLENTDINSKDIKDLEDAFLVKGAFAETELKEVILPDGTKAREEILNYNKLKYVDKEIGEEEKYKLVYLGEKLFHTNIGENIYILSNSEDMVLNIKQTNEKQIFYLDLLDIDINAKIGEKKLEITIK